MGFLAHGFMVLATDGVFFQKASDSPPLPVLPPSDSTPFPVLLPFFSPQSVESGAGEKKSRLQMLPNLLCLTPEPLAFEKLNSQDLDTFFPLVTF